jgi:hypothetical protein
MKSDLDHLPANKQRELERVVQLIFKEFEDAFAHQGSCLTLPLPAGARFAAISSRARR